MYQNTLWSKGRCFSACIEENGWHRTVFWMDLNYLLTSPSCCYPCLEPGKVGLSSLVELERTLNVSSVKKESSSLPFACIEAPDSALSALEVLLLLFKFLIKPGWRLVNLME